MHLYFSYLVLIAGLLWACNSTPTKKFERIDGEASGFVFYNEIKEDSVFNALDFTNLYTGSGVGVGDINNDGLEDIFMGGCMSSSKLFLNKGDLKFEDITLQAGVETDRWITGVAMVDINQDAWMDIYLSVSGPPGSNRRNLLFLNKQDGSFREAAAEYGIDDPAQCTHSSFFDYDKDGDLDLFLAVNPTDYTIFNVNTIRKKKVNGEAASTDKLYRNDGKGIYTDVSREAGILIEGYSLGLNVSDINGDHWPDIYVTNDFLSNDILYINQKDGSFKNEAANYFKHTSFASMGIDIADINDDALPDIYVLDMFPEDNFRQKMLMPGADYNRFEYIIKAGYEAQYSRNTLQWNQGNTHFSEIGQLASVHKTDWSWSPLIADFDNDGQKDIFVGNGFLRDMGDLDYINYNKSQAFGSKEVIRQRQLEQIRQQKPIKIPNYLFKNEGDFQFAKVAESWGLGDSSCSNGAAYADLDLDGDLDLIVNNLNQPSFLYENKSPKGNKQHYLQIKLEGESPNQNALGSKIWIYTPEKKIYHEYLRYRGYESSMGQMIHIGLGEEKQIDSLKILWPNLEEQTFSNLAVDTLYTLKKQGAKEKESTSIAQNIPQPVFQEIQPPSFLHKEDFHVDFYVQSLLPHQFTQLGPALAKADVNGDGLEDFYVGGASTHAATFFIQKAAGEFEEILLEEDKEYEDVDALFFDADGDKDPDLYVVSGGSISGIAPERYQDRLYLNDGKGNFSRSLEALPEMHSSTSCVRAADFDGDGDEDLFVGGRLMPGKYPNIPPSYLLENQGGRFVNIIEERAPELQYIGMLTDAEWIDIDQDEKLDLILLGEWMPISIFLNKDNSLEVHKPKGLSFSEGWWNCIEGDDFDGDGDIDFLAGNLGLNTNYRAKKDEPVCIYAKDFDKNGSIDPILCQFIRGTEYPIASRDNLIKQLPYIESRFSDYKSYAMASFEKVFSKEELADALILKAHNFKSAYIENLGNGEFVLHELAPELQIAPIQDIWSGDIDGDKIPDALLIGNAYDTEVKIGRYDAFKGAYLKGKGDGSFEVMSGPHIGFLADRNARKLVKVGGNMGARKEYFVLANNADSLQVFTYNQNLSE